MNQRPASTVTHFAPEQERWTRENCGIAELFNEAHERGCSIARARVRPGQSTERHVLSGTTEWYVIVSGRGEVEVDGEAEAVGPFDVVHIPPGSVQRITSAGAEDLVFLCVCTPAFAPERYAAR
ncbi:MAG TPA: cupin domain-containing protein [Opitutaceae bacterium]|nr:cupin domain-containing protein [Opitutaceae bacterium]